MKKRDKLLVITPLEVFFAEIDVLDLGKIFVFSEAGQHSVEAAKFVKFSSGSYGKKNDIVVVIKVHAKRFVNTLLGFIQHIFLSCVAMPVLDTLGHETIVSRVTCMILLLLD